MGADTAFVNPSAPATTSTPLGTRARRRARTSPAVPYDFSRPIQLSREHSRILQLGLDGFARQATTVFTSALRTVCSVQLLTIDQRTYAEYVDSLDAPTYLTMFSADPMPGHGVLEIPLPATMACVDHMLGGPGRTDQPSRPLTEIEGAIVKTLVERLLGEMRYALAAIVDLEPTVTGIEYSPQFAQVAGAADVMVVATFDLRIDDAAPPKLTICLPFNGLLPHLVSAAAPPRSPTASAPSALHAADLLAEAFNDVPVDVAVRFRQHPARTPTRSPTSRSATSCGSRTPLRRPLDVAVDDTSFAHATAGATRNRLAALIVATPKEN